MVISELLHCNRLVRLVLFMIINVLGFSREREPTGYIYKYKRRFVIELDSFVMEVKEVTF